MKGGNTNGGSKEEFSEKDFSVNEKDIVLHEKDKRCAPHLNFEDLSCIPLDMLVSMANTYNDENDKKIKLSNTLRTLNPSKYKKYLLKEFSQKFKKICDSQRCWLEQEFVELMNNDDRIYLMEYTFRPKGPQGKFEWLNTFNINDCMKQYEMKYKDFKFLGAVPIDFDDLPVLGIKDINCKDCIKQNKSKLGIIFNLDKHNESGSHWVSLFIDIEKGFIFFSDSYGIQPHERIRKFMRRIAKQIQEGGRKLHSNFNKTRHQKGDNACGMYSICFIVRLLAGENFYKINKDRISDEEVNKYRDIYFV